MFHNVFECFAKLIYRESLAEMRSSNKYEGALDLMGVSPDRVILFENQASDIEMAALAGVPRQNIISVVLGRGCSRHE